MRSGFTFISYPPWWPLNWLNFLIFKMGTRFLCPLHRIPVRIRWQNDWGWLETPKPEWSRGEQCGHESPTARFECQLYHWVTLWPWTCYWLTLCLVSWGYCELRWVGLCSLQNSTWLIAISRESFAIIYVDCIPNRSTPLCQALEGDTEMKRIRRSPAL